MLVYGFYSSCCDRSSTAGMRQHARPSRSRHAGEGGLRGTRLCGRVAHVKNSHQKGRDANSGVALQWSACLPTLPDVSNYQHSHIPDGGTWPPAAAALPGRWVASGRGRRRWRLWLGLVAWGAHLGRRRGHCFRGPGRQPHLVTRQGWISSSRHKHFRAEHYCKVQQH